ncbi:MAG: hypothetical protein KDK70_28770 [Myxococcales bacterium]|nr:hypothetical protein [Myxococcales bacterium]
MTTAPRRLLSGLGLGLVLGAACYDGPAAMDTEGTTTTGPMLCTSNLVTCPDGTCVAPGPGGVCCGHGGVCPSDDTGPVGTSNMTTPTSSIGPPDTTGPGPTTDPTTLDPTTGSSSSDDGSSSSTGDPPMGCYDPGMFPYAGPLCGPAATPCTVQAAETIEPMVVARNGTPSIAFDDDCEPAVLHAQSVGGTLGFFAQRVAANTWDVQPTPFDMVQGGLDYDPVTGFFGAMVYEGSFDVSARIYDGMWGPGDYLVGNFSLSTKAFALTGDVALHGLLQESGVGLRDVVWDGAAWVPAVATTGGPTDLLPALAVAPDGTHHFTYWAYGGMEPALRWETSAGAAESVTFYGDAVVSPALAQEIALTDDMGTIVPHVLAATATAPGNRVQVVYLRRDAVATWTSIVLAAEDPTGETTCDVPPMMPGESCTLDRTTYRPLAIAASLGGDVRWLYTQTHELVDYIAECLPDCTWTPLADMSTYDTHLGWLEGGMLMSVELLPDTRLVRGNLEIDGQGTMHLVAYADEIPDTVANGTTVEYFRIGP